MSTRIRKVERVLISMILFSGMSTSVIAADNATGEGMMFYVNDPAGRNSVVFKSQAPLEDIVGTTGNITGYMMFDPLNPQADGQGEFMVPVADLDTGIPLRDEHLRGETWLNAAAYPMIVLKINELTDISEVLISDDARTFDVVASGDFSLHGITRTVEVPGRITYLKESEATSKRLPGHILAVRGNFTVALADYGIVGSPGLVGSKVGEVIDIEVSIMGSTGSEKPSME